MSGLIPVSCEVFLAPSQARTVVNHVGRIFECLEPLQISAQQAYPHLVEAIERYVLDPLYVFKDEGGGETYKQLILGQVAEEVVGIYVFKKPPFRIPKLLRYYPDEADIARLG